MFVFARVGASGAVVRATVIIHRKGSIVAKGISRVDQIALVGTKFSRTPMESETGWYLPVSLAFLVLWFRLAFPFNLFD